MKYSLSFFFFIFMFSGISIAQSVKPNPIPSFGITVDTLALFTESGTYGVPSKAKKYGYVKVYKSKPDNLPCNAVIYWYSLDGLDFLGPFSVTCGALLVTPIDEREWGTLVISENELLVDVWIE